MKGNQPKIVVIVGPTASGKTAIGVKLAKKFNGEIVSADSRQIFRGLDLGTGKEGTPKQKWITNSPNSEYTNNIEQLRHSLRYIDDIPQWMIDIVGPCTTDGCRAGVFNLFKYTELAKVAIEDILSRGKLPIIVGGTGLYIQGLTEGFSLKSETNSKIQIQNSKQFNRTELENQSIEELQGILKQIDNEAFEKLNDNKNPHRLLRAIERVQSGLTMTKVKPDWDILQIAIDLPKEVLNQRIDKRVEDRFKAGMLNEVEDLLESRVDSKWLLKLGLEYKIITKFLISNCSNYSNQIPNPKSQTCNNIAIEQYNNQFQSMKEELKLRSHQYAKRQMTWFKRFQEIIWLSDYEEIEKQVEEFI